MKRLLLALALLLSGSVAFAQSGGSSAAGGGLSTKAILALEECFDDFDTFICTGGGGGSVGGSGTTDRIPVWTAATTLGDSSLSDNGTSLSGSYGGTISLSATGDVTLSSSDEIFLTATADVNIPDDVELVFGTTATAGGPGNIVWNTFAGGGVERLEIDGEGNAGVLVSYGNGSSGGFNACDGGGSFVHCFTMNPPAVAGASLPTAVIAATGVTSMDDAGDQRIGLDLDMESGATDVAGSQQIGMFIEGPTARPSTQDALVLGTTWDNQIVVGDEVNRTALNWAAVVGSDVVTVPSETGTILLDTTVAASLFPLTSNTIVTSSGVEMQFGGTGTFISSDGSEMTLSATGGNGESIIMGSGDNDGIFLEAAGETMSMVSTGGGSISIGQGDEELGIEVDSIDGTILDNMGYSTAFGWILTADGNGTTGTYQFNAPPSAGGTGELLDINATLAAMDGTDRVDGVLIDLFQGVDTGASNALNGIYIDGISGNAATLETAINIQDGWDDDIHFESTAADITYSDAGSLTLRDDAGETNFVLADLPIAAGSGDAVTLDGTLGIMDGSDTVRGVVVDLTNANHTGTGNVLTGLEIAGITADADATETALSFGAGWDNEILFQDLATISATSGMTFNTGSFTVTGTSVTNISGDLSLILTGGTGAGSVADISLTADDNISLDATGDQISLTSATIQSVNTGLVDFESDDRVQLSTTDDQTVIQVNESGGSSEILISTTEASTGISLNATGSGGTVTVNADDGIRMPTSTQANLGTPVNGTILYCTNCNPNATCTSGGSGAFAFRINGAWACELN